MEDQRNIKWVLIISLIMFFVSFAFGLPYSYPGSSIWFFISRVDALLFIATITTGALFTTGFARKELMYRLTIYFFIISMGLFFLGFIRWFFSFP